MGAESDLYDDDAHPFDGKFEPEAKGIVSSQSDAALVSIAVSLKRIADALPEERINFSGLDNMLWQLGQTFGRAIEIGSRRS